MRGERPRGGGGKARPSWARVGHLLQGAPAIRNPDADLPRASPEAERTPHSAKAATSPWAPAHSPTWTPGRPQQPRRRQAEVRMPQAHVPGGRSSLILSIASWPGQGWPGRDAGKLVGKECDRPSWAGPSGCLLLGASSQGRGPAGRGRLLPQPGSGSEPPPGPAPWDGAGPRSPDPRRERPPRVCAVATDRLRGLWAGSPKPLSSAHTLLSVT